MIENPNEIKIIVSDIDGTILPYQEKDIPEEIYPLIESLHEKGIRFMIASGRNAYSIKELFHPVSDIVDYIAGNGTIYVEGNETIFTQPFEQEYVREFLDSLHGECNFMPAIMTDTNYYLVVDGSEASHDLKNEIASMKNRKGKFPYHIVKSAKEVKETICKLGVYQKRILEPDEVQVLRNKWQDLELVCGGGHWLDVMQKGANKGSAIERILERYHLTTDNLMTFGDNENDLQMLSLAKYGYAVSTAAECAKEAAAFQCDSVLETIKELLEALDT